MSRKGRALVGLQLSTTFLPPSSGYLHAHLRPSANDSLQCHPTPNKDITEFSPGWFFGKILCCLFPEFLLVFD